MSTTKNQTMTNVECRNGKYYTDKATIDKIGRIEARGEEDIRQEEWHGNTFQIVCQGNVNTTQKKK